ncbi:hypothetical protein THTE_1417 [Thermogutta terrifontis]|uniref:Uncharacterized protein n=1 Tax=Thermogutta terrifontis TaxID=1331910 RepID=A0A286RDI0_9BACT|nr:hypothetical protein THTE_1417 [Thermogutta terrifontis]
MPIPDFSSADRAAVVHLACVGADTTGGTCSSGPLSDVGASLAFRRARQACPSIVWNGGSGSTATGAPGSIRINAKVVKAKAFTEKRR